MSLARGGCKVRIERISDNGAARSRSKTHLEDISDVQRDVGFRIYRVSRRSSSSSIEAVYRRLSRQVWSSFLGSQAMPASGGLSWHREHQPVCRFLPHPSWLTLPRMESTTCRSSGMAEKALSISQDQHVDTQKCSRTAAHIPNTTMRRLAGPRR